MRGKNGFLFGQFHHATKGASVISEGAIASSPPEAKQLLKIKVD